MKNTFDNSGFSQVESNVLALTVSDRRLETDFLRSDPIEWLLSRFEFSPSQELQLNTMDPVFLQRIATAVANSWDSTQLVSFYKQPTESNMKNDDEQKTRGPKDILFDTSVRQSQTIGQEPTEDVRQVAVTIQYR